MSYETEAAIEAATFHSLETGQSVRVGLSRFVIVPDMALLEMTANGDEKEALGIAKASPGRPERNGRMVYLFEMSRGMSR